VNSAYDVFLCAVDEQLVVEVRQVREVFAFQEWQQLVVDQLDRSREVEGLRAAGVYPVSG
jgi:hypothetical protein